MEKGILACLLIDQPGDRWQSDWTSGFNSHTHFLEKLSRTIEDWNGNL